MAYHSIFNIPVGLNEISLDHALPCDHTVAMECESWGKRDARWNTLLINAATIIRLMREERERNRPRPSRPALKRRSEKPPVYRIGTHDLFDAAKDIGDLSDEEIDEMTQNDPKENTDDHTACSAVPA